MCFATVVEKATNTAIFALHQLSLHQLKDMVCSSAIGFCYSLENLPQWKLHVKGRNFESALRLQACPLWNCHVNGTTFQSGLRFQTGLSSLQISCKRALTVLSSTTDKIKDQ